MARRARIVADRVLTDAQIGKIADEWVSWLRQVSRADSDAEAILPEEARYAMVPENADDDEAYRIAANTQKRLARELARRIVAMGKVRIR